MWVDKRGVRFGLTVTVDLLVAEGDHRVSGGGACAGDEAGSQSGDEEERGDEREGYRVERGNFVEEATQQSSECDGRSHTEEESSDEERESFAEDEAGYACTC
jgi:hypothetical protein